MHKTMIALIVFFSMIYLSSAQIKTHSLIHEGIQRDYLLYVPDSYQAEIPTPLLFALHGGGGTSQNMIRLTENRFNILADEQGYIVVYPQGLGNHWNDGRTDLGRHSDTDDIGFFSALIDKLSLQYNIDPKRIFSTGISNGALMSYRLACELSDKITGVAPVAGNLSAELAASCQASHAINMMIILGADDPQMPYEGGQVDVLGVERGEVFSAQETLNFWRDAFHCSDTIISYDYPNRAPLDGTQVSEIRYPDCDESRTLVLVTIQGGGHTWAGGWQYFPRLLVGNTSRDINATDLIWEFFRIHS